MRITGSEKIDRRQLLRTIALGSAAVPMFAAQGGLQGTAINHVSYASADYRKTRDFYSKVFGFQVADEDDKQLYLWAGDSLISAKNTPTVTKPYIDHFGLTVDPWDLHSVAKILEDRGLMARVSRNDPHDSQGKSAFTRDPNGYNLQLGAKDLEDKPPAVSSKAPLQVASLNHISYQCADYKKTRDFYTQLLNVPVSNDDGKQAYLWFGDAFLVIKNSTDGNVQPRIDHMAWNLADWDKDRVAAGLKQHGLESQVDQAGLSIMTKDLNGFSLQLCSRELAKKP